MNQSEKRKLLILVHGVGNQKASETRQVACEALRFSPESGDEESPPQGEFLKCTALDGSRWLLAEYYWADKSSLAGGFPEAFGALMGIGVDAGAVAAATRDRIRLLAHAVNRVLVGPMLCASVGATIAMIALVTGKTSWLPATGVLMGAWGVAVLFRPNADRWLAVWLILFGSTWALLTLLNSAPGLTFLLLCGELTLWSIRVLAILVLIGAVLWVRERTTQASAAFFGVAFPAGLWVMLLGSLGAVTAFYSLDSGTGIIGAMWFPIFPHFEFRLIGCLVLALVGLAIVVARAIQSSTRTALLRRKQYSTPPLGALAAETPTRVAVNRWLFLALLCLAASTSALDLAVWTTAVPATRVATPAAWMFGGVVFGAMLLGTLFFKGLQNGLDVTRDVLWYLPGGRRRVAIQRGFSDVLQRARERDDVGETHIIAHSLGSLIALDTLNSPECALKEAHLLTIGSPISHLMQHYFGESHYPGWNSDHWTRLRERVVQWRNGFFTGDAVGTVVEGLGWPGTIDSRSAFPPGSRNVCLGRGRHTDYLNSRSDDASVRRRSMFSRFALRGLGINPHNGLIQNQDSGHEAARGNERAHP